MLFTLSLRLRKHRQALGAFHAWNQCLNHILALANSYIEGVIFKCFLKAVEVRHAGVECVSRVAMVPAPVQEWGMGLPAIPSILSWQECAGLGLPAMLRAFSCTVPSPPPPPQSHHQCLPAPFI